MLEPDPPSRVPSLPTGGTSPTPWASLLLMTLAFAALWLWQVRQTEAFLEADACTHFLIARFALDETYRFVDIWGRPFKTALYAVPAAYFGRLGVQTVSLGLALLCAAVAYRLAREIGLPRPDLAYGLTLAQPLLFLHSFSELTELPFAALLAVAVLAFVRRWWILAGLLTGLLPLARPEGFGFVLLAAVVFLGQRRPAALAMLPLGLAAWTYLGWEAYGRDGPLLTWLPRNWPYAGDSVYTEGTGLAAAAWRLVRFPLSLPAITGPAVFPGLLLGIALLLPRARHCRTTATLLLVPLSILVGHSILYCLGKMATNGELRYLLIVAPFWAVLTAFGWNAAFQRLVRPPAEAVRFAAYAALIPLLVNLRVYTVLPLRFDNDWHTTRFLAEWAHRQGPALGRPNLMAAHPGVWYFLDRSNNAQNAREFNTQNILNPPTGTILLFDPVYARYNASRDRRIERPDDLTAARWQELPYLRIGERGGWRVFLSPDPQDVPPETPATPPP